LKNISIFFEIYKMLAWINSAESAPGTITAREITDHQTDGFFIDCSMDSLAVLLTDDKARAAQFLHVMGYCREGHIEVTRHIAYAQPVFTIKAAPAVTGPDMLEHRQAVFVRERLHGCGDCFQLVRFT
jgi:hypothetical protein